MPADAMRFTPSLLGSLTAARAHRRLLASAFSVVGHAQALRDTPDADTDKDRAPPLQQVLHKLARVGSAATRRPQRRGGSALAISHCAAQ